MTLLRHPVVITSLEEDFRKIGLIKSDGRDEDDSSRNGLMESADDVEVEDFEVEDDDVEEGVEDDDIEEGVDDAALEEAVAFNESFAETWKSLGEDGVETIVLDESEMAEMETLSEEVVELPAGVLPNILSEDDEDEDEDLEESEEDYDEDESGDEYGMDAEVEGDDGTAFESVAESLRVVESLMEGPDVGGPEQAIPAFANMALIAEKLYGFFAETAEAQDDAEYAEISEAYKAIGKYSAGIVDTLQTEDPNTIDMDVLSETFKSYLGSLLEGLETYALLREADAEGEEYDEGEEEDDEYDEDDEGNE